VHNWQHLFLTPRYPPLTGTMARWQWELSRRLDGQRVLVSTVSAPGTLSAEQGTRLEIRRQPFGPGAARRPFNRLRWASSLLRSAGKGTIVHAAGVDPAGALAARSRWLGAPYVLYVTGSELLRERNALVAGARLSTLRAALGSAAGIVAESLWSAVLAEDLLHGLIGSQHPPVMAVELGVDPTFFRPDRNGAQIRARYALGNSPLLLTVARLLRYKGCDTVLKALARLLPQHPDLHYLIVGSGPEERQLRALAAALGIERRVIFAGELGEDDLADSYAAATLFVMVPRLELDGAEGLGLAFLEASASGLPVVAGDSGGVRGTVRHRETGLLVDPDRDVELAAAVAELLGDPAQRGRLGEQGRKLVESRYNWDRVAAETTEFVRGALVEWQRRREQRR
jgi:phosphatidylinositol alpha-1,6-mannosyltransferase